MAKYSRYDPNNKKKSRNKKISLFKDLRIREVITDEKLVYIMKDDMVDDLEDVDI
jgi:hypothetical protein